MITIRYGYDFLIECPKPTPLICMLDMRQERQADVMQGDGFHTDPFVPSTIYRDAFGNACRRLVAPKGTLRMWSQGIVRDTGSEDWIDLAAQECAVQDLPDDTLMFLLGSRYCETDRISQRAWDMFGTLTPGWGRVQAISDFVHGHITFDYMQARATRTAYEALEERIGVCRDFAHTMIALCRSLNIPARYVNGYLGDIGVPVAGPMDYAAWVEVYLGGRWATFDPRNNARRIGRIKVAHGRDAADVPLIHSFGPHVLTRFTVICEQELPLAA